MTNQKEKTFLLDLICDDLSEKIIDIVEIKRTKEKYDILILHLNQYVDEYIDDGDDDANDFFEFSNAIYDKDNLRIDCRFLEYNGLWNTQYHKLINEIYGEAVVNYFMEMCF